MAEKKSFVHWRMMMDNSHLRAEMFEPNKDIIVTIGEIRTEEVTDTRNNKSKKPVAYFVENVAPLVLNVANCTTITEVLGTGNILEWPGKRIQLFTTTTKVAGQPTPCVRVRKTAPAGDKPVYRCIQCGKEITQEVFARSMEVFGKPFCSKECQETNANGKDVL